MKKTKETRRIVESKNSSQKNLKTEEPEQDSNVGDNGYNCKILTNIYFEYYDRKNIEYYSKINKINYMKCVNENNMIDLFVFNYYDKDNKDIKDIPQKFEILGSCIVGGEYKYRNKKIKTENHKLIDLVKYVNNILFLATGDLLFKWSWGATDENNILYKHKSRQLFDQFLDKDAVAHDQILSIYRSIFLTPENTIDYFHMYVVIYISMVKIKAKYVMYIDCDDMNSLIDGKTIKVKPHNITSLVRKKKAFYIVILY